MSDAADRSGKPGLRINYWMWQCGGHWVPRQEQFQCVKLSERTGFPSQVYPTANSAALSTMLAPYFAHSVPLAESPLLPLSLLMPQILHLFSPAHVLSPSQNLPQSLLSNLTLIAISLFYKYLLMKMDRYPLNG